MAKKQTSERTIIADNRRAYFDYDILEKIEAGIVLKGTEVKTLRLQGMSLKEAHAGSYNNEIALFNTHIAAYPHAHQKLQHEPYRIRSLLLHKKQMNKLLGSVKREGISLIPLRIFFNKKGIVKLELGVTRGRKKADKREAVKTREWKVEQGRLLKKSKQE